MEWFYLALLAPLFWALVIIIDDNLIRSVYRTPYFGAIISAFVGSFSAITLFWAPGLPSSEAISMAMLAGFLISVFFFLYFLSFETESPSVIGALLNLVPAFVPFLAYIFLREQLSTPQYVGLALVVGSSLALTVVDIKKFKFSRAVFIMTLAALLYAAAELISKHLYNQYDFLSIFGFISLGMAIGGIFFLYSFLDGRTFWQDFKKHPGVIVALLVVNEILYNIGHVIHNLALSTGPVSAIVAIEGIQPAYILILAVLLAPLLPKYFRESTHDIKRKLFFIVIMLCGLYLIYV